MSSQTPSEYTTSLLPLWQQGLTQKECAAAMRTEFHRPFTINAIAGLIYRARRTHKIDFVPRAGGRPAKPPSKPTAKPKPPSRKPPAATKKKPRPNVRGKYTSAVFTNSGDGEDKVYVPRAEAWAALTTPKSLLDLKRSDCRWPVGLPEPVGFCGLPVAGKSSYCAHHRAISYAGRVSLKDA